MKTPERRTHGSVLPAMLDLSGKRVVDIGCGDGGISRLMAREGAKVTGIEPNPAQLEKAQEQPAVAGERYIQGIAQNLPMEENAADIVVFFNSLHHVPAEHMIDALREVARVLKPGGLAYIAEPVAEGDHFELMQPVHDETIVRAQAYEAIKVSWKFGLKEKEEVIYTHPVLLPNFAAFRERMLRINPGRKAEFDALEPELTARYERLGTRVEDGREFDQPMRVNLLERTSAS